jgi:hypothetical protein
LDRGSVQLTPLPDGGAITNVILLNQQSVQAELKLTDEQVKYAAEQIEKQRASRGDLRQLSRKERQTILAVISKAENGAIAAVLKEDQFKRLKQISLQERGAWAWNDPEIATALDLTGDQKEKLWDIQQSVEAQLREDFQAGTDDPEAARKKIEEARVVFNEKAQAILTSDQKEKWKTLVGEPFKGEIIIRPFRGGIRPSRAAQD